MMKWSEIRETLLTKQERDYNDTLVAIVGTLVMDRKGRELTQADIAEQSGLKQASISRFEGLDNNPRMETVIKVAHALGYTLVLQKIE